MRAGKDKDHPGHLIGPDGFRAVRGAAVYGANAAGKSNLVLAMGFARDLIVRGRSFGQALEFSPFELCDEADGARPSGFHWYFVHEGKMWSYGFEVLRRRIVEEYLFARDVGSGKELSYFSRSTDEAGKTSIKPGAALVKGKDTLKRRLKDLELNMKNRPEQPFLTLAIENSIEEFGPVYEWFSDVLQVIRAETVFPDLLSFSHSQEEFLGFLSEFVRLADTGIERLVPEETEMDEAQLLSNVPDEFRDGVRELLVNIEPGQMSASNLGFLPVGFGRKADGRLMALELNAEHKCSGGRVVKFRLDRESEGTQRLLHLLPILFAFKNESKVIVIDELERRLHTKLSRRFVEMALHVGNREGNQLVFTTHDTNLLDSSLLRRDEIHFARKKHNRTSLERLSEYQIRNYRDYEKAYSLGRVGGGGPRLSYELFELMEEDDATEPKREVEVAAS